MSETRKHAPPGPPSEGSLTSVAEGATLRGTLSGAGFLVVDGLLEGGVELDGEIVVRPGGRLVGRPLARAERIRVEGSVAGTVEAGQFFEALSGSRVEAEVSAPAARIEPGAWTLSRVRVGPSDAGPNRRLS